MVTASIFYRLIYSVLPFALGAFDSDCLAKFPVVVMRGVYGKKLGFANLWPGNGRHELSIDLMRHRRGTPAVTMDALFAGLPVWARDAGYPWSEPGAAPFAGMTDHRLAGTWDRLGAYVYQHGDAVYDFEGLRVFKEKFDPVWTPKYFVCPQGLQAARVLVEVDRLISGGARKLLGWPQGGPGTRRGSHRLPRPATRSDGAPPRM